jgi:hypothetical protein
VVYNPDRVYRLSDSEVIPGEPIGCAAVDAAEDGDQAVFLCQDGRVRRTGAPEPSTEPLSGPGGEPLMQPVQIARVGIDCWVLDAGASELVRYDERLLPKQRWVVPHLHWQSPLAAEASGLLYLRAYDRPVHVFAPDGALLFHPVWETPDLFEGKGGERFGTELVRRLSFAGDRAVAVVPDAVYVFEKR